jgi:hypothetical protein
MRTIKEYIDANGKTSVNAISSMKPLDFQEPVSPGENLIPKRNIPTARKEKNDTMVAPPEDGGFLPYSAGLYPQDENVPLGENNPYNLYNQNIETGPQNPDDWAQQSPWPDNPEEVDSMITTHWQVKSQAPKVLSESGEPFHPDPIQSIKYVTYLAEHNDFYKNSLMLALKKAKLI